MESTGFEVKLLSYVTLCNPMDCSLLTRPLCPWNSSGKTTRVACHFLLQGIFPTRGSNLGLPHCRQTLCPLSHQGSPTGFMVGLLVRAPRRLTPRLTSQDCCYQCLCPCGKPLLIHTSTGDPQTLTGSSGFIRELLLMIYEVIYCFTLLLLLFMPFPPFLTNFPHFNCHFHYN